MMKLPARVLTMTTGFMFSCAMIMAFVATSLAAPVTDQNVGTWSDNFVDSAGIAFNSNLTTGVRHDAAMRQVALRDDAPQSCRSTPCAANEGPGRMGTFATVVISPASFSEWRRAAIRFSAADWSDIEVSFRGENGQTFGPLPLEAENDAAWTAGVDLRGVPATIASGRLVVRLRERVVVRGVRDDLVGRPAADPDDMRIRPTVEALRVAWTPRTVIAVGVEAPETVCANASFTTRVRVAVSLVRAEDLVVWAPVATAAPNAAGLAFPLEFRSASHGGVFSEAATTVNGVLIPARSVYWVVGAVEPGTTFVLSYNAAPPLGTLDAVTYAATASASPSNGTVVNAPRAAVTRAESAARLVIRKTSTTAWPIFGRYYIDGGKTLGFNIFVANWELPPNPNTCTAALQKAVIYDDVSDLVNPLDNTTFGSVFVGAGASAFTISHGGVFTSTGTNVNGVMVPPNSIYWDLGVLPVGERRNVGFSVSLKPDTLRGGPLPADHRIRNRAVIRSGVQADVAESAIDVFINVPNTPSGVYAVGDRIRGSTEIAALRNDNPNLAVGYGDPVTFALLARNGGASQLADTLVINKIPAGTTFSSAFLPANARGDVLYSVHGEGNDQQSPPDFNAANGTFGPSWTTSSPSTPASVRWVAFRIPRLASPFIPAHVIPDDTTSPLLPSGVIAELNVVVTPPADGCPRTTIENTGLFATHGFIPVGETAVTRLSAASVLRAFDVEPVEVLPVVPSFEYMNVGADTTSRLGAGDVTFLVNMPNRQPAGVETDTARDVVVTIAMPRMSLNGVLVPAPFVSADAPGGRVELQGLPESITLRYPTINPLETRVAAIRVNVPRGFVSGQNMALAARLEAQDDVCGVVSANAARSVQLQGNPHINLAKRVTLGVATPGSEIDYIMSYNNSGDAVSTGTWLIDRVPAGTRFVSAALVPASGEVWFSAAEAPVLPASLRADGASWEGSEIQRHFVRGVISGGRVTPPAGFGSPTWLAFRVDHGGLLPPQLPATGLASVRWTVAIEDGATPGELVRNEAAVFSTELLPAVSNEALTMVSDSPSLSVTRACPDVISAGDIVTWRIHWVNDSTNADHQVVFTETLPPELAFVGATHVWNAPAAARHGTTTIVPVWDAERRMVVTDVSRGLDPTGATAIRSLEGGVIEIRAQVAVALASGDFLNASGWARATDPTGVLETSFVTACPMLVANADLFARISVDEASPIAGEIINLSLGVSNEGLQTARDTTLTLALPAGLQWTANLGHPRIVTPGWTLGGAGLPVVTSGPDGGQILTWSVVADNAIAGPDMVGGAIPARSEAAFVSIPVKVGDSVGAGVTLAARLTVGTSTGEDPVFPNEASVVLTTPHADAWLVKTGPETARPGARVTYRLQYGNRSRQAGGGVILVDRLFDAEPADGAADVTVLGVVASNGEQVYFNTAPLSASAPAFDPLNPGGTGWTSGQAVSGANWVGIHRRELPGNAGPFNVFVDIALRAPVSGLEPIAGSVIPNVGRIAFVDATVVDGDPTNNESRVETRTPGIDLQAVARCDPGGAFPGALPGQDMVVTLELANTGTVAAYGLKFVWSPPSGFLENVVNPGPVVVVSEAGLDMAPVDASGVSIGGSVEWTRDGNTFILGSSDAASSNWYRRVGLPAGARARLQVRGRLAENLVSGAIVAHTIEVTTDYRFDHVAGAGFEEVFLVNNRAQCSTTAVRADPLVLKSIDGVASSASFGAGDRVTYRVAYNNVGAIEARDVMIEDNLPAGAGFVVGSMSNQPDGTVLQFDDGTGRFTYEPVGDVGDLDPNVAGFRLVWQDPMPAPVDGTFRQETRHDFWRGEFFGTRVSDDGEQVVIDGRYGNTGRYLTPPIPGADVGRVNAWGRVVAAAMKAGAASMTVSLIDAATDEVIAAGLVPDESGAIDIAVDAERYPEIRLAADMTGQGVTCSNNEANVWSIPLDLKADGGFSARCGPEGHLFGWISRGPGAEPTAPHVWERQADGSHRLRVLPSARRNVYVAGMMDAATVVGTVWDSANASSSLVVWERRGGVWEEVTVPPVSQTPRGTSIDVSRFADFIRVTNAIEAQTIGAYLRVGGTWSYRPLVMAPGETCSAWTTSVAGPGVALMRCSRNDGAESFPVRWRPGRDDDGVIEYLPIPSGLEDAEFMGFGVSADAELFTARFQKAGELEPRVVVFEWQDTHWQVTAPLFNGAPLKGIVMTFGSRNAAGGRLYDSRLPNHPYRPFLLERQGQAWAVTEAPPPPGLSWGATTQVASGGVHSRSAHGAWHVTYLPDTSVWGGFGSYHFYRNSTGALVAVADSAPAGAQTPWVQGLTEGGWLFGQATFNDGTNRSSRVLWEPTVATDGRPTFRVRSWSNLDPELSPEGGNGYEPLSVRNRLAACGIALFSQSYGFHKSALVPADLVTATTFATRLLPLPTWLNRRNVGQILATSNGAFVGETTRADRRIATVFVPTPSGTLTSYVLTPEATIANDVTTANWVSPDFQVVVGTLVRFEPSAGVKRTYHRMWTFDTAANVYRSAPLVGAGVANGQGTLQDPASASRAISPMAVVGNSLDASGTMRSGFWYYTPGHTTPMRWMGSAVPDLSTDEPFVYFRGGGANHVVISYENTAGKNVKAVAERDPSTPSGLRFTVLGPAVGNGYDISDQRVPSDVIVGMEIGDWIGYLWRLENGTNWVRYRTNAYQAYLASRRLFGPLQLPLVVGPKQSLNPNGVRQPSALTGGEPYVTPAFSDLAGHGAFDAANHQGLNTTAPREAAFIHEGFVIGTFPNLGVAAGYQYLRDDLTWIPGRLAGYGDAGEQSVQPEFVIPGPILLGWSRLSSGRVRPIAWHFPDGNMANPVTIDLRALVAAARIDRSCSWAVPSHTRPDANGHVRTMLSCEYGSASAVVASGPDGLSLTWTTPANERFVLSSEASQIAARDGYEPRIVGCSAGGGVGLDRTLVTWRTDTHPSFAYVTGVPEICQDTMTNVANIFTSTPQMTEDNDRAAVSSDVASVDLAVNLAADRGAVLQGDVVNYTIVVENNGRATAHNVVVQVVLPDATGGDATTTRSFPIEMLGVGETRQFAASVTISAAPYGHAFHASATVTSDDIECDAADNDASVQTPAGSLPNVAVTLTGPALWVTGTDAVWTAVVRSNGNVVAEAVTLTLTPPDRGVVAAVEVDTAAGLTFVCGQSNGRVTCPVGSMTPAQSGGRDAVVRIVMRDAGCAAIGARVLTEAVVAATLDASQNDNRASMLTDVAAPSGRIRLGVTSSRATMAVEDDLSYYIYYTNDGTGPVEGAVVAASLPPGLALEAGGTTPGYQLGADEITWLLPTLAPGQGGILSVSFGSSTSTWPVIVGSARVEYPAGGPYCPGLAPYPQVSVVADGLYVTKHASSPAGCGGAVDWFVTVTNSGPTTLRDVVVTDAVPAASPYLAGSIRGPGASDRSAPLLVWTIPELAAGASVTLGYASRGPSATGALVSNRARVQVAGVAAAESSEAVVWATCAGDGLRLTKVWDAGCVVPGQVVAVAVSATNVGRLPLANIAVHDPLPDGFVFLESSTGANPDVVQGSVEQSIAVLAPGETRSMRYLVRVEAATGDVRAEAAVAIAPGLAPQASNPVTSVVQACDDGVYCTQDRCEVFVGCVHVEGPRPGVSDATCDGFDDDCDGDTDEDWVDVPSVCGLGVCQRAGIRTCPSGAVAAVDSCEPGMPLAAADSQCDGRDEDCDGGVDEDYRSREVVCGETCDGVAATACREGEEQWDCEAARSAASGARCDDGDACSATSTCDGAGACVGREAVDCDDGNTCTDDRCDPAVGCVYDDLDGMPCDDADLCTSNDLCVQGSCGGDTVVCDTPGVCEAGGVCNPTTGQCEYTVLSGVRNVPIERVDIGTFEGQETRAHLVNGAGAVAGRLGSAGSGPHAFYWTESEGVVDLTPDAKTSGPTGLNDAGHVAGVLNPGDDSQVAFGWKPGGALVELYRGQSGLEVYGPSEDGLVAVQDGDVAWVSADGQSAAVVLDAPDGGTRVRVRVVGAGSHVVGSYLAADGAMHAFNWHPDRGFTIFGTVMDGEATAVNTFGDAVGSGRGPDGARVAYIFRRDGTSQAIEIDDVEESWATAISDDGMILGQTQAADGRLGGFVRTQDVGLRVIGLPTGDAIPMFINRANMIAGAIEKTEGVMVSAVWLEDGRLFELPTMAAGGPIGLTDEGMVAGITMTSGGARVFVWSRERGIVDIGPAGLEAWAHGMNASGQVVGESLGEDGAHSAFVTRAPEVVCVACDEDTEPPVLLCPSMMEMLECGGAVALGEPLVYDGCGGAVAVSSNAPEYFEVGTTEVVFTATDTAGNIATCGVPVVVADSEAPVLECPAALAVRAATGACEAALVLPVTATDRCDGEVLVLTSSAGPLEGGVTLPVGTTAVTVTATDSSGRTASCSIEVTVTESNARPGLCDPMTRDGLVAQGGACAGGEGGWPWWLLGLSGLVVWMRRRCLGA